MWGIFYLLVVVVIVQKARDVCKSDTQGRDRCVCR